MKLEYNPDAVSCGERALIRADRSDQVQHMACPDGLTVSGPAKHIEEPLTGPTFCRLLAVNSLSSRV
jgi:hypothetical protein